MKKQITILITLAILSSNAFAQGVSKAKKQDDVSSQGIRVSAMTSVLQAETKATIYGQTYNNSESIDQTFGFSVGYASLPVQSLGWTSNVAYLDIQTSGQTAGLVRIDGNLAYAFTNILSLKGGLNVSKFISGTQHEHMTVGLGAQASVGVQITKNFGFDVGYTQMNQSGSIDEGTFSLKESGLEIGLNGTF